MPVVADGMVYTFGAEGELHAVNVATGQRVWSEDTTKRLNVQKGFFGAAGSPLVEGGQVMANVGGPKAGIVASTRNRPGAVDRDDRSGELLVGRGGDVPIQPARDVLTRNALVGSIRPPARARVEGTGRRARTPRSTSQTRWSSTMPILSLERGTGPGTCVLQVDGLDLVELEP